MRPDPKDLIKEATRLKDQRFNLRDAMLLKRETIREMRCLTPADIPEAYRDTNKIYHSPAIEEEGKQVYAIVEATPQPRVLPPSPEMQALSTLNETWLAAGDIELDQAYGHCLEQSWMSQIHTNIGWVYEAPKRKPYDGQPEAPETDNPDELTAFYADNDAFKRESGIAGFIERRFIPTGCSFPVGKNVWNPLKFYEIKDIDEDEFIATYDLRKNSDGSYSKPDDLITMPSGNPPDSYQTGTAGTTLRVIEYWDRNWCMIVAESPLPGYRSGKEPMILEEWEHNWGRVPYFPCPAWEKESFKEDQRFAGPLDGLYVEIERLNRLVTMKDNTTYLRSYPSWQDVASRESDGPSLDEKGNKKTYTKYQPGQIYHTDPGHEVRPLPMDVGPDLLNDIVQTEMRIKQFSISDVSKGISPGADTANSAITQLRRLQRSSLERLAKNRALQMRSIYQFRLARLKELGETVYVYDETAGDQIGLSGAEVVSLNLHVKYAPDTGQDNLIEEKQAAELAGVGLISELEFHERRGKENPEEYLRANVLERMWKMKEPALQAMVLANLGDTDAIGRLIAENQQSGDARNAVQGIMADVAALQQGKTGMGSGSGGMPRAMGVRSPAIQETTQPAAEMAI